MRFATRTPLTRALLAMAALGCAAPAAAWFTPGHALVTRAAIARLPAEVPAFFREAAWGVGQASVDPDVMKSRATPELRAVEEPEHYLDWELLRGAHLPPGRWAYLALLHDRRLDPQKVGTLPYAVHEQQQRLTIAFAEHRRWPDDPWIRQRVVHYAGYLAHYAGDLEQPLHTTVHHDGRALPDDSSPRTGIHQLVDGLFERLPLDTAALTRNLAIDEMADPWAAIKAEMTASHALVDRVYELEPALRAGAEAGHRYAPPVVNFTEERFRATARFLASLYYTAWRRSAGVEIPSWHTRPAEPSAAPVQTPAASASPGNAASS
jgi:hypothetical protein